MIKTLKGQVWIETVLYTLIGLVLIGLVLAFVTPKINDAKDRAVVEQTISSLNGFDEKINAVLQAPDNRRLLDFTIKRGQLYVDGVNESIVFVIDDLKKPYSQPGIAVPFGRVSAISQKGQKMSSVVLTLNYSGQFNFTYKEQEVIRKFTAAQTPYTFSITNKGFVNNLYNIDVEEISGR